jgi:hypothetical protein
MVDNKGPGERDEAGGDREHEDEELEVGIHPLVHQLRLVDPVGVRVLDQDVDLQN